MHVDNLKKQQNKWLMKNGKTIDQVEEHSAIKGKSYKQNFGT